jgi:hypothetical protein
VRLRRDNQRALNFGLVILYPTTISNWGLVGLNQLRLAKNERERPNFVALLLALLRNDRQTVPNNFVFYFYFNVYE